MRSVCDKIYMSHLLFWHQQFCYPCVRVIFFARSQINSNNFESPHSQIEGWEGKRWGAEPKILCMLMEYLCNMQSYNLNNTYVYIAYILYINIFPNGKILKPIRTNKKKRHTYAFHRKSKCNSDFRYLRYHTCTHTSSSYIVNICLL